MNRCRSRSPTRGLAPGVRRHSPRAPLVCCLGLLVSCAPGGDSAELAAEETAATEPAQEQTATVEDAGTPGADMVAVDLPGLPIGGADVTFSAAEPAACVSVNWTAGTLVDGVRVAITELSVPEQFTISADPCSSTPCIGSVLTASAPGCQVGVVWTGGPVDSAGAELSVTDAALACVDQSHCRATLALIEARGDASIALVVIGDEPLAPDDAGVTPGGDGDTPGEEDPPPDEGDPPPGEEAVSPGEGSS